MENKNKNYSLFTTYFGLFLVPRGGGVKGQKHNFRGGIKIIIIFGPLLDKIMKITKNKLKIQVFNEVLYSIAILTIQ